MQHQVRNNSAAQLWRMSAYLHSLMDNFDGFVQSQDRALAQVPHVLYSLCELDTAFLGLSDVDAYCATSATSATVCNMLAAAHPRKYAESVFVLLYLI